MRGRLIAYKHPPPSYSGREPLILLPRAAGGNHFNAFHKGMLPPRQHFSGPVAPSLCCRKAITTLIADYNNPPSPSAIWIPQDHMEHEWAFNRSLYFARLYCNFRPLAANTAVWFDCGSFCKSPLRVALTGAAVWQRWPSWIFERALEMRVPLTTPGQFSPSR